MNWKLFALPLLIPRSWALSLGLHWGTTARYCWIQLGPGYLGVGFHRPPRTERPRRKRQPLAR